MAEKKRTRWNRKNARQRRNNCSAEKENAQQRRNAAQQRRNMPEKEEKCSAEKKKLRGRAVMCKAQERLVGHRNTFDTTASWSLILLAESTWERIKTLNE